jgi:hypothetical protein
MSEKSKCAHPACHCPARPDSKYCSQYCEDAAGTLEIACNCGHDICEVSLAGEPAA